MDDQQFDALTRTITRGGSRRSLLGVAAAALGLGAAVGLTGEDAGAAPRQRCLRKCNDILVPIRRRNCQRRCRTRGAGNPIGQGGAPAGSVCSKNSSCDTGYCANISPGSGLGRCASCPGARRCGNGSKRQCCVSGASCVEDICVFA